MLAERPTLGGPQILTQFPTFPAGGGPVDV
jgi:hypothetical protein